MENEISSKSEVERISNYEHFVFNIPTSIAWSICEISLSKFDVGPPPPQKWKSVFLSFDDALISNQLYNSAQDGNIDQVKELIQTGNDINWKDEVNILSWISLSLLKRMDGHHY